MSSKRDIWMPLYIGDYLRDTMELSATEHGIYLLLLMHYWVQRHLTDDMDRLIAIAHIGQDGREMLESVLSRYFQHGNGCYQHKRVERELQRRDRQSAAGSVSSERKTAAARENARRGGRPRRKPNEKPNENPTPQSQSYPQSQLYPEVTSSTEISKGMLVDDGRLPESPSVEPQPRKSTERDAQLGREAKECLDYHFAKHIEVRGYEPIVAGGRDMKLIKTILRKYDTRAFREVTDYFFGWKERVDFGVPALFRRFDTLYGILKDKAEGRRS